MNLLQQPEFIKSCVHIPLLPHVHGGPVHAHRAQVVVAVEGELLREELPPGVDEVPHVCVDEVPHVWSLAGDYWGEQAASCLEAFVSLPSLFTCYGY